MKIGEFDELNAGVGKDGIATGDECFVIVGSHWRPVPEFERTFKVYAARAARHFMREGHLQVQTEAAKRYHRAWRHMSFDTDTGRAIIDKCARLVVPETMDEQADLEHRAKVTACPFVPELAMNASARALSIAETRPPADVAPRPPAAFGLLQPPEDFEE